MLFLSTGTLEDSLFAKQEAKLRLESATHFLMSSSHEILYDDSKDTTQLVYNQDTVKVKSDFYGVYKYGVATTWYRGLAAIDTLTRSFLLGSERPASYPALYQFDSRSPLLFAGSASVEGDVLVSPFGISQALIGGISHSGDLVTGTIGLSASSLPKEPFATLSTSFARMQDITNDSTYAERALPRTLFHPFSSPTIIMDITNEDLSGVSLSGNLILKSDDQILIPANCTLDGVILYGPQIVIEENARGNFQAFATESIVVENNVLLSYPSFLFVFCPLSGTVGSIHVKENVIINGGIALIDHGSLLTPTSGIKINTNSLVRGQVVSEGYLELTGEVHGSVICHTLQVEVDGTLTKSALLNGRISSKRLPSFFQHAYEDSANRPKQALRWIN